VAVGEVVLPRLVVRTSHGVTVRGLVSLATEMAYRLQYLDSRPRKEVVMAGAIWFAVCAVCIVGFMTFVGICFWQMDKALDAVHDDTES